MWNMNKNTSVRIRIWVLLGMLLLVASSFFIGRSRVDRGLEFIFQPSAIQKKSSPEKRANHYNSDIIALSAGGHDDYFDEVEKRLGVDLKKLLSDYKIDTEGIELQVGGRNPDVIWLHHAPRLDLAKLVEFSTPLYDPSIPTIIENRKDALAQARMRRVVSVGQVWLAYEDKNYYYFAGGDALPNFDFSVGTVVERKTGSVRYWFRDRYHAERPILKKITQIDK
jgi:hypothetical protein